jgi:hypothetical protein
MHEKSNIASNMHKKRMRSKTKDITSDIIIFYIHPESGTIDILGDIQAGYPDFQDICPTLVLTLESKRPREEQI